MSGLASLAIAGAGVTQTVYNSLARATGKVIFLGPAGTQSVMFDITTSEGYASESVVTQFPIEDGSTISDHVILTPGTLDITGEVTDTPLGMKNGLITEGITTAANVIAGPLGVVAQAGVSYVNTYQSNKAAAASASATNQPPPTSASIQAYRNLLALQQQSAPITVQTKIGSFPNFLITSLAVPRSAQSAGKLVFQVSLVLVRVVSAQVVGGIPQHMKAPALGSGKKKIGEVESADPSKLKQGYDDIQNFANNAAGKVSSFTGNLSSAASQLLGF